jgi:dTDP-4-amino-4,6-dideoxygalactose transaminase
MTANHKVPFLDLVAPHLELEEELTKVFQGALQNASFIGGPAVEEFEQKFASFCGTKYCVGVGSGTDALRFALIAAGVRPGDSVITVPNTFIATTEAISQAGAMPEFVDINELTYNMDPAKLHEYLESQCDTDALTGRPLSRRTGRVIAAIVPVHLYGQTVDMDPILAVAERHNLSVVEDACQAHGAEYFSQKEERWTRAGSKGKAASFSFYPGKNLGACGEAGAITTNDEVIAQKCRMLRDHGQARKYYHSMEGYNGRLDAIQAGILRVKLGHLSKWNEQRRVVAGLYRNLFSSLNDSVVLPYEAPWSRAVYHLYVIRSKNRDELRSRLAEAGIDTGIHYPIPLHLQEAYRDLGYKKGDFPISEQVAAEAVSLPMFPTLSLDDQRRVVDAVGNFVSMPVI